mmetsp:Transcript_3827/g.12860  ORF Transcript_3827/g.12860 Transcript_3827/m.12860 type:complete len:254 (-) Transcript_3827:535-1296(-)
MRFVDIAGKRVRSCRGDSKCDAACSAAARANPLAGVVWVFSTPAMSSMSPKSRAASCVSSPLAPTTTSPFASTRTTSSLISAPSSSGAAGAITPRAAVISSNACGACGWEHLSGCTSLDSFPCAALASFQPAPGSKSNTAGAPQEGRPFSCQRLPAASTDSRSEPEPEPGGVGVSGEEGVVFSEVPFVPNVSTVVCTGVAAARAGIGAGAGNPSSPTRCFPPELAYSHISRSGHAPQLGVLFSQNTFPSVIMW